MDPAMTRRMAGGTDGDRWHESVHPIGATADETKERQSPAAPAFLVEAFLVEAFLIEKMLVRI
jgi:hypothetical protein